MTTELGVVISLHPHHAARIYAGVKRAEFRRRRVRLSPGEVLYIYETAPISSVTGMVQLADVTWGRPGELLLYETDPLERAHVQGYLNGTDIASALHLREPTRFPAAIPLSKFGITRPPQSYFRVKDF